jgi:predicted GNAT superfamily acetyltransferase
MAQAQAAQPIEIRHCSSVADYQNCVHVEHAIWGKSLTVPVPLFVVARETGGQVLGAFQQGGMIGLTLAFAAMRRGKTFLHSHIAAVLPGFRDRGVGRAMKLFQRQDALDRGIDLIEWTFDPLDLKNAYFNLVRLGAIARRCIPNCYGVTESPLHAGLPTDRLVVEWLLNSDRVKRASSGEPPPEIGAASQRIAIPAALAALRESDREAAAKIQSRACAQFQEWFAKGWVATGVDKRDAATDYLLEPAAAIAGLKPSERPNQS